MAGGTACFGNPAVAGVPVRLGEPVVSPLSSWRPEALPLPDCEELDVTESDPDDICDDGEDAF